jgi:hypothetical protein
VCDGNGRRDGLVGAPYSLRAHTQAAHYSLRAHTQAASHSSRAHTKPYSLRAHTQATDVAIAFYERLGFVRVGAIAKRHQRSSLRPLPVYEPLSYMAVYEPFSVGAIAKRQGRSSLKLLY